MHRREPAAEEEEESIVMHSAGAVSKLVQMADLNASGVRVPVSIYAVDEQGRVRAGAVLLCFQFIGFEKGEPLRARMHMCRYQEFSASGDNILLARCKSVRHFATLGSTGIEKIQVIPGQGRGRFHDAELPEVSVALGKAV